MIDLTPVTTPRTSRRLRASLAGLALVTAGLLVPGAAGADTPPAPAPVPEFAPAPDGGGTGVDGPDGFAVPGTDDDCHPLLATCDIAIPEDGDDPDDCHPLLATCDIAIPEDGDDPDDCHPLLATCDFGIPEDGDDPDPETGGGVPGGGDPEGEGAVQPTAATEVRAAEVATPIRSTPTFTG